MPDLETPSRSDDDVVRQLLMLGDAAFVATDPVTVEPGGRRTRRRVRDRTAADYAARRRLLALAAAVLVAIGIGVVARQRMAAVPELEPTDRIQTDETSEGVVLEIDDPTAIDLRPLLERSLQQRLELARQPAFRPVFDGLDDWEVMYHQVGVREVGSPEQPALGYEQSVSLNKPGESSISLDIIGAFEGQPDPSWFQDPSGGPLPESLDAAVAAQGPDGSMVWATDDGLVVSIYTLGRGEESAADLTGPAMVAEVARALRFEVGPLEPPEVNVGEKVSRSLVTPPLLAGRAGDDLVWFIDRSAGEFPLSLAIGLPDEQLYGWSAGGGWLEPPGEVVEETQWMLVEVPSGRFLFGLAPQSVERVELTVDSTDGPAVALLPVAGLDDTDGVAFAVPVDDRLDPIRLRFLAADGALVHSEDASTWTPSLADVEPAPFE